jgi:iron complex transport system ATP-binding protein
MSLLEFVAVHAAYPSQRSAQVLLGVDLHVAAGEMVALIGPNGAGKSTVMRLASGVLRPSAGRVLLEQVDLGRLSPRAVAQRVAAVTQEGPHPPGIAVHEMVALGRTPHVTALLGPRRPDRESIERALATTGTAELAERFVDELSGGERQRVVLARALAQDPRLLLLDEPTANLDLFHQVAMLDLVRRLAHETGLGVLAAVHDLQLAALYCDRVVLLRAGEVVSQGTPEAVLTESLLLSAFGQPVALSTHPTHGVPLVALVPNGHARRAGS